VGGGGQVSDGEHMIGLRYGCCGHDKLLAKRENMHALRAGNSVANLLRSKLGRSRLF
jgi:hypothetical protein